MVSRCALRVARFSSRPLAQKRDPYCERMRTCTRADGIQSYRSSMRTDWRRSRSENVFRCSRLGGSQWSSGSSSGVTVAVARGLCSCIDASSWMCRVSVVSILKRILNSWILSGDSSENIHIYLKSGKDWRDQVKTNTIVSVWVVKVQRKYSCSRNLLNESNIFYNNLWSKSIN